MASRFRRTAAGTERPPPVPECEAPIMREGEFPSFLADASRASASVQWEDGPPAVACQVDSSYYTATNWGMRHDNEDRPVISKDTFKTRLLDFHMIGVLDGHDTADASDLVSKELPKGLARKLKEGLPVSEAYKQALAELEERLKKNPHPSAGTCVINCLLAGRHVWCANLGDCRAVLIFLRTPVDSEDAKKSKGPIVTELKWLSRDHKASSIWERERIQKAGGVVQNGRVEGLEPSRTLGDFDVKMQVNKNVISIIPEIRMAELGDGTYTQQALLVCGTDGIWDVLSGQDICSLVTVRKELIQLQAASIACASNVAGDARRPSAQETAVLTVLAEDFVQFSIAKGSRDDCTAVVSLVTPVPVRCQGMWA